MTFLEAALEILKRERKPLHYKELTERAMEKKLLTFVGRTPEVTMQTQLTAAVKKAPGSPFVRVKPGVFGLLRYPETPVEPEPEETAPAAGSTTSADSAGGERGERGRRRRRGGRGRGRGELRTRERGTEAASAGGEMSDENARSEDDDRDLGEGEGEEPEVGALSPEARAAALGEIRDLEGAQDDDDDDDDDAEGDDDEVVSAGGDDEAGGEEGVTASADAEDDDGDDDEDDDEGTEDDAGAGDDAPEGLAAGAAPGGAPAAGEEFGPGRRRRRRRRRRGGRGGENGAPDTFSGGDTAGAAFAEPRGETGDAPAPAEGATSEAGGAPAGDAGADQAAQAGRRIMAPIDAAIEILKGQPPGRGVHVRQIADAAVRRRLIHGEPNEAWRVLRAALAAEPRERLRAGQRPRVRAAGSGLYALARRPPDMDLERAEYVFGEARRALRERTLASLEGRLGELSASGLEAITRVLLQREGFGPATFVKRVEGTIYLEALRGRGSRPSRCLIALRPGSASAGRRAIGELRAGIRARNQDEGLLILANRLGEDALAEWRQPGPPVEVVDGPALAETCVRHGVGVQNAMVSVDFVDADFFAEISEG